MSLLHYISSFLKPLTISTVALQPGLCRIWSETAKTGFSHDATHFTSSEIACCIIIIIIMSLFYEDNIFSTSTNLTYGPRWKTYHTEQYHTIYTLYT